MHRPRRFPDLRHVLVAVWRSGSALVLITEVNLRRARLVLGWVTVSGFDSRGVTLFRYITSHPGRLSLLPSAGRQNEYHPNGGDALWQGSKGRYGLFTGGPKTERCHM